MKKSLLLLSALMSISLISCGGAGITSNPVSEESISSVDNSQEIESSQESLSEEISFNSSEDIISSEELISSEEEKVSSEEAVSSEEQSSEHEHVLSEWIIENPTYTATGSATKKCVDEDGYEVFVELPTLDDENYVKVSDTSSCNAGGIITYSYPNENGAITFEVETSAKGHNYLWVDKVSATTESSGMEAHYYCDVCDSYFDPEHKLVDAEALVIPQISVWSYNETHHWINENDNYEEHIWDEGVSDGGSIHYGCTVCEATKVEEIPIGSISEDYFLKFEGTQTLTGKLKIADGIRLVASTEKVLEIAEANKSSDGNQFTHMLKLGGKINSDSRYIELNFDAPCKMRIYAINPASGTRSLGLYNALVGVPESSIIKTMDVASGSTISKIDVIIKEKGTYYIGSTSGGINVFGINIVMGEFCEHDFSNEYSYDEFNHYYECLNGCGEVSSSEGHIYDSGVVKEPATEEKTGIKVFTCTTCGRSYEEIIPIVTHHYSETYEKNETHHWNECIDEGCDAVGNYAEHDYDEGEVIEQSTMTTNGKAKYTCITCGYEKTSDLPLIPAVRESKLIVAPSEELTITDSLELAEGVKVVASEAKTVTIDAKAKSSDGNQFTHAVNLGGKANPDSRYIEITVAEACTVRIYALCKSSAPRNLAMFSSTEGAPDVAENILSTFEVTSGGTIEKIDYTFTGAGTYYLGSMSGAIYVFGLSFTF